MDGMRDGTSEGSTSPNTQQEGTVEPRNVPGLPGVSDDDMSGGDDPAAPRDRIWRQELPRWLATLDSQRTSREYEKAVGYFFRIPSVPDSLGALTFDLLLAYRGSLALRADRTLAATSHGDGAQAAGRPSSQTLAGESSSRKQMPLPSAGAEGASGDGLSREEPAPQQQQAISPLAPATVNIRLTALRQFLAHCSLWGFLPDLPPDRIRAALRRLRIERRRPYQILAEPEWTDFLRAARAPGMKPSDRGLRVPQQESSLGTVELLAGVDLAPQDPTSTDKEGSLNRQWWGAPRANRERKRGDVPPPGHRPAHAKVDDRHSERPHSATGLTGTYTAQRDYALLALALATGLRAIELCSLDLGDLAREWNAGREEWWLVLPDAKTKGQHGGRTLPLAPSLTEALLEYATTTGRQWARATDRATPLFLSQHYAEPQRAGAPARPARAARGRLSAQHMRRIVDRVERQWLAAQHGDDQGAVHASDRTADTRAISPHALRHSTAVALLEGNERSGRAPASVEHVRGWLGHFDIRTTQGYLAHLDARRHRRPFVLQPVEEPPISQTGAQPDNQSEGRNVETMYEPPDEPPDK